MVTNQTSAFVLSTHWVARVCILLVVVPVRRVRDTCSTGLSIVLGHACRARASLSLSLIPSQRQSQRQSHLQEQSGKKSPIRVS